MFWLLEKDSYDSVDNELLIQALKDTNTPYCEVGKYELLLNDNHELYPDKSFFYGSINTAIYLRKKSNFIIPDFENYNCLKYYPELAINDIEHLNGDGVFMSISMLKSHELVKKYLDLDDGVFIRPVSGLKTFNGQLVSDLDLFLKEVNVDYRTLVVVSKRDIINQEYRFVIVDGKIVSSGLYKENNLPKIREGCPELILNKAEEIISKFNIDCYYVMDIAKTYKGYALLIEYNALNTSGLYAVNRKSVVEAMNTYYEKYENDDN